MGKEYDGRGLRLGRVLGEASSYTRRAVTYRSGDLRISGIINIPRGDGPFPVLVLLHGYIDPAIYVTGAPTDVAFTMQAPKSSSKLV